MKSTSFKAMHYFSVVGQLKSFKLAAEKLFVSQAAVSQQIKLLEKEVGQPLLIRHGSKTDLSRAGRELLPHLVTGFTSIDSGFQSVLASKVNKLNLSCPHSFANFCLINRLKSFQAEHKHIALSLSADNTVLDESQFHVDLAIRYGKPSNPSLEYRELVDSEIVLVYSPLLIKDDKALVEQLNTLPFLLDDSADIEPALQAFCQHNAIAPDALNIQLRVNDSVPIIHSVLSSTGIGLVNSLLVSEFVNNKHLRIMDGFSYNSPLDYFVVAPSAHFQMDKSALFLSWLFSIDWYRSNS